MLYIENFWINFFQVIVRKINQNIPLVRLWMNGIKSASFYFVNFVVSEVQNPKSNIIEGSFLDFLLTIFLQRQHPQGR